MSSYAAILGLHSLSGKMQFADDIFKCKENVWISLKISLKFVPKFRTNHIPALVQIMAWRRSSSKPLSEPMMVSLLMQFCISQSQLVKTSWNQSHKQFNRQISNIRCTKSHNFNVSPLVLQLSLRNLLKPGVKSRMKMWLEQRRQVMLQLHLSDQQFNCRLRCVLH